MISHEHHGSVHSSSWYIGTSVPFKPTRASSCPMVNGWDTAQYVYCQRPFTGWLISTDWNNYSLLFNHQYSDNIDIIDCESESQIPWILLRFTPPVLSAAEGRRNWQGIHMTNIRSRYLIIIQNELMHKLLRHCDIITTRKMCGFVSSPSVVYCWLVSINIGVAD